MKKLIALLLAVVTLFAVIGCAAEPVTEQPSPEVTDNAEEAHEQEEKEKEQQNSMFEGSDALIMVKSDGVLKEPYLNYLWSTSFDEENLVSADSLHICDMFEEISHEIPQITYADDFEVYCREGVELNYMRLYHDNYEVESNNFKLERLADLEPGEYYLCINVSKQGDYIAEYDAYEGSGYECGYKVIIKE